MATFTKLVRNVATFTKRTIAGGIAYLLTDDSSNILVGSASDEVLILSEAIAWTNQTKN